MNPHQGRTERLSKLLEVAILQKHLSEPEFDQTLLNHCQMAWGVSTLVAKEYIKVIKLKMNYAPIIVREDQTRLFF